jgi:hypothetical protein
MHRGASAPGASNASVPKELDAVILRAVSPNPDSRYQSVVTLAAELRSMASALERGEPRETENSASSTTVGSVVLTTVAILAVVAAILWWVMRS